MIVEGGVAVGVATEAGEEYRAPRVVSNADPQRSLLTLVDPAELDAEFRTAVEGIDMRGSMARIHLLIDELPQYLPFESAGSAPSTTATRCSAPRSRTSSGPGRRSAAAASRTSG